MSTLRDVQEWLGSEIASAEMAIMHGSPSERSHGESVLISLRRVRNQLDRLEVSPPPPAPACLACRATALAAAMAIGAAIPEALPAVLTYVSRLTGGP